MPTDYSSDDQSMFNLYKEGMDQLNGRIATGQDQFTPKLKTRGNPNTRLSYASYFEEDEEPTIEPGEPAVYQKTGETVNVVTVNSKTATATIELPDETRLYNVSVSLLDQSI